MKWSTVLALTTLLTIAASLAPAPAQDDEEKAERLARSRRILDENCLMCHSEELIVHQRLTSAQWKAEVVKMVGWGSPLPPEELDGLAAYLAETYPAGKAPVTTERLAPATIAADFHQGTPPRTSAKDLQDGGRLFVQHCATCHGPDARGGDLGQNLVSNPALLRVDEAIAVVREGRRRMPGFMAVLNDSESRAITLWLLGRPGH